MKGGDGSPSSARRKELRWLLAALCLAGALIVLLLVETALHFFAWGLAGLALALALWNLSHRMGRGGRLLRRALAAGLALGILCFCALEAAVVLGGRTRITRPPDVMVVLGAHVRQDGPSPVLEDRLETAADYLLRNPELPVVVTGGQGSNEPMSEAQCMYEYLTAAGVEEGRIWREDRARNTDQNLRYTAELLAEQGFDLEDTHVLLVSSGFHLCRASMLADRVGLDTSTLAAPTTHPGYAFANYVRETLALVKSWCFDR